MDEVIEVKAVRVDDVVIYRRDVAQNDLKVFSKDPECKYIVDNEKRPDNIKLYLSYKNKIVLQDWKKYKVQSLNNSFSESDFTRIGEFGTDSYGTLMYKNCIGITYFKKIQLIIESQKLNSSDLDLMSETVNMFISNLSYDFNQPTFSKIARNRRKTSDLDYHKYLLIMNMMRTSNNAINFFANFKLIENNPNRQMVTNTIYEDSYMVGEVSVDAIVEIISGNTALVPCKNKNNKLAKKLTNGSESFIPDKVRCDENVDSFDNNENRFIKYFMTLCLWTIEKFQDKFKKREDFLNKTLIEDNKQYIGILKNTINNTFLKDVGEMQNIPMYSTVLTQRDGYRQLFKIYLGLKSIPENAFNRDDLEELVENKSIDVLYENYCYFSMAQILANVFDEQLNKKKYKVNKTEFSKTLEKKTNSNYFIFKSNDRYPSVRLNYNKNYDNTISYSKVYAPDISLEILDQENNITTIYLFDAKFKATITSITKETDDGLQSEEKRNFKYDDISKMHTYKDAIKLARGAFVLYPGTERKVYYEDYSIPENEYQGVGAFGLRPGKNEDSSEIKKAIEKLLGSYTINGALKES